MNIDTSGWGPFDPSNPDDLAADRERVAFTEYMVKRLRKAPRTGSSAPAIWTGGIMAIVAVSYSMYGNNPPDSAREALHDALDFAWLQSSTIACEPEDLN
jgi:hypothetical protein